MNSPGSPEERGLPGVAKRQKYYRSAVVQCGEDVVFAVDFPYGKNRVGDMPGYRSQARNTPG